MAETFEYDYMTDDPAPAYGKAIRRVKTKEALIKICEYYGQLTRDALSQAKAMEPKDLGRFHRDTRRAAKETDQRWCEKFNGEWGAIVMPANMLFVSLVANKFKVPWGVAFIRSKEEKVLPLA